MQFAPMLVVDAVGVGAGLCSMISFVPQIVKLLREKEASGVSLRMFVVTACGFALWMAYGLLSGSWPVAASNMVNLMLASAILVLTVRAKHADGPQG